MWIKPDDWGSGNVSLWSGSDANTVHIMKNSSGGFNVRKGPDVSQSSLFTYTGGLPPVGQWTHIALVRNGTKAHLYFNGIDVTGPKTVNYGGYTSGNIHIGTNAGALASVFNGKISNVRFTKSAVYTSSFRPPTEPLTNITNTELLCCNNSSVTGSTVTPGTIASSGGPSASTDSPFDDPAGFVFGENGDQGIIKTGSYVGNGNSTGPEIFLGWEPQWVMVKRTDGGGGWLMLDTMRGWFNQEGVGTDKYMFANTTDAETSHEWGHPFSTGMTMDGTDYNTNTSGASYVYIAIRRSDGYCGKPFELGSDCFQMDAGNSNADQAFTSGFPVDFALYRQPASAENWRVGARLLGRNYLEANNNVAQGDSSWQTWDDNTGFAENTYYDSTFQAWMWSRGQGFDVVCYPGREFQGRQIPHSLSKIPEMILIKNRTNATENWAVYHKGLNGGTNPEQYYLRLNTDDAEIDNTFWYDTAPTSTHFSVSFTNPQTNQDGKDYLAMLFASVDGISKVGSYTGDTNTEKTITVGFQPRFILIRAASIAFDWHVFDTTRGMTGSGNDARLYLNATDTQNSDDNYITGLSSTGFTVGSPGQGLNGNGVKYIYYAHA